MIELLGRHLFVLMGDYEWDEWVVETDVRRAYYRDKAATLVRDLASDAIWITPRHLSRGPV